MVATETSTLCLEATDLSGQNVVRVRNIPTDRTVGEFIGQVIPRMGLVDRIDGRPISYSARLDRVGRHLHAAERVADAVEVGDRIVLTPAINAGGGADQPAGSNPARRAGARVRPEGGTERSE